jgi:hypothetical protein
MQQFGVVDKIKEVILKRTWGKLGMPEFGR